MQHAWSPKLIKAINLFLLVLVVGVPLIYWSGSVYPYTIPKTVFFLLVSEFILALYAGLAFLETELRPKRTLWFWAALVFMAALFLVSFLGKDFSRSFWSIQERNLGVFLYAHFGLLAIALAALGKKIDWLKVWKFSLAASAAVALISFAQLWQPDLLLRENTGDRTGATFGNPTFMAGYILFHIFLGLYVYLRGKNLSRGPKKYWPLGVVVLDMLAVFVSQTRGDILGLGAGILALLVFWSFRPPFDSGDKLGFLSRRRFYAGLVFAIIFLGGFFWLTRSASLWSFVPGLNRFQNVSLADPGLQPRLIAINAAWQGIKEKPLLGWGWENFNLVFGAHYNPGALRVSFQETRFDKPHNFFLEYLVAGGILLALAFLFLCFAFVRTAWRAPDKIWGQIAIVAFAAYFVQNLFVFDVIGPLLMFYLFMSATAGGCVQDGGKEHGPKTESNTASAQFILGIAVLIALIMTFTVSLPTLFAAGHQRNGFVYFLKNKAPEGIAEFREGISGWSMYRDGFAKDYARAVADGFYYKRGTVTKEDAAAAARELEAVSAAHPQDANYHNMLLDFYNKLAPFNPEYLKLAEEHAQKALALSPNRQETYFGWAKTRSAMGDNKGGLELTKKALDLDPEVPESQFFYGLMAYVNGMEEEGYKYTHKGITGGRPWKNSMEPRVVANFYVDDRHFSEAIELYRKSLDMREDPETRARLGRAYFLSGDRESARSEFEKALKQKDLSQSSAWEDFAPIVRQLGL